MAAAARRDLYLQVSGDVTGLSAAMKTGKSLVKEFGSASINVLAEVERKFSEVGTGGAPGLRQVERAYESTLRRIRDNARSVVEAPSGQAAIQIIDANATRDAAAAAEGKARAFRLVAEAATRADQAQVGQNAAVRAYAVAAAAAAVEAEQEARALREQAGILAQVEGQLESTGAAQRRQVAVNGQARAGFQQLSFQLGDVATQYASGTSAALIFAQQSGQVIQAIQLIAGETKGLIGVLAGPWGIAITAALVALTPLVAKMLDGSEAAKEAKKASEDLGRSVDDIGAFFDRTTGKIRETNRALVEFAILSRQRKVDELRASMQGNARAGAAQREESTRNLKPVFAERGLGRDAPRTVNFDVADALKLPFAEANARLREIARSTSSNAAQAGNLLKERAQFASSVNEAAKINAEIRSLQNGTLDRSLRTDPPRLSGGSSRGGSNAGRAAAVEEPFELRPFDIDSLFDPSEQQEAAQRAARQFTDDFRAVFGEQDLLGDALKRGDADLRELLEAAETAAQAQAERPLAQYRNQLEQSVGDLNAAFEDVDARALASLEDGLAGVIAGTDNVGDAFRRLSQSIIADLARIAVQRAILGSVSGGLFGGILSGGFADGGKIANAPGYADGGIPFVDRGLIRGPGDGRSDSILALVDGRKPIRVSNGEAIVNERGVRKHWALIDAINKDRLPKFADGGLPGMATPTLPSITQAQRSLASTNNGSGGLITLKVALTEDLHTTIDNRAAGVAVQVYRAGAPELIEAASAQTMAAIGRQTI